VGGYGLDIASGPRENDTGASPAVGHGGERLGPDIAGGPPKAGPGNPEGITGPVVCPVPKYGKFGEGTGNGGKGAAGGGICPNDGAAPWNMGVGGAGGTALPVAGCPAICGVSAAEFGVPGCVGGLTPSSGIPGGGVVPAVSGTPKSGLGVACWSPGTLDPGADSSVGTGRSSFSDPDEVGMGSRLGRREPAIEVAEGVAQNLLLLVLPSLATMISATSVSQNSGLGRRASGFEIVGATGREMPKRSLNIPMSLEGV
jgi:hypothetical protein